MHSRRLYLYVYSINFGVTNVIFSAKQYIFIFDSNLRNLRILQFNDIHLKTYLYDILHLKVLYNDHLISVFCYLCLIEKK